VGGMAESFIKGAMAAIMVAIAYYLLRVVANNPLATHLGAGAGFFDVLAGSRLRRSWRRIGRAAARTRPGGGKIWVGESK
jgi:hypothetical protein